MDALAALQLKKKKLKEEENYLKQQQKDAAARSAESNITEQRRLNQMFGFPNEPSGAFSIARGVSAAVWWTYSDDLESIIGWEVHRYRKDPNQVPSKPPEWQYKGMHNFAKLEKLQVIIDDLATSQEYRFTVKAINSKGRSVESAPTNAILIELPLPSGWFRFYDERIHRPYYASIKSNRCSWTRPESDPFFLDDLIFLNFEARELKHLKALYVEDIAHFQSINIDQFQDILREIGEKGNKSYLKKLFMTYANDLKITEWVPYMEIMNHFKLQHLNRQPIASCHLLQVLFQRNKVQRILPPDRDKLGSDWEVEFNTFAQRLYYRNTVTGECTWHMPDSVKFFLSPVLERKLLMIFDYYEIDELKRSFSLLDVDNSGDLSESEIKLLLGSMGIKINEKKLQKLMKAIDTNNNGTVEFDEFCWMMYEIKRKERRFSQPNNGAVLSRDNSSQSLFHDQSSVFSDEGFKEKFSLISIFNGLHIAAKGGKMRRRSFSESSIDDSVSTASYGSHPKKAFVISFFLKLFRRNKSQKVFISNGEEMETFSEKKQTEMQHDQFSQISRKSSLRSIESSEEGSSVLEASYNSSSDHHKFTVRRKSSFRDLSEEGGSLVENEASKKHSKHCFCGCRRY